MVVSLGYGSSLLVCQVLPGKTEYLADRKVAGHPIAREAWDSRQVKAGKVWVIPEASQILPFCIIHCYFHPAGPPKNLSDMTSQAAGVLARSATGVEEQGPTPGKGPRLFIIKTHQEGAGQDLKGTVVRSLCQPREGQHLLKDPHPGDRAA